MWCTLARIAILAAWASAAPLPASQVADREIDPIAQLGQGPPSGIDTNVNVAKRASGANGDVHSENYPEEARVPINGSSGDRTQSKTNHVSCTQDPTALSYTPNIAQTVTPLASSVSFTVGSQNEETAAGLDEVEAKPKVPGKPVMGVAMSQHLKAIRLDLGDRLW